MPGDAHNFLREIGGFLGGYYALIAALNFVAAFFIWHKKDRPLLALVWLALGGISIGVLSPLALAGHPVGFPQGFRSLVNLCTGPVVYSVGILVVLTILLLGRRFFVRGEVAWAGLNLALLSLGLSMTDFNFAQIVTKADNVPIVGLIFLLGFFTWLATSQAVKNDDRRRQGLPPLEKQDDEKVLVWPDLVYIELICMILITALLLVWAISLQAPLEEPASSVKTPNPSKAPWYFLGLQEMLVYFDPWMAGVVLPSMIVAGLAAIPYIDFNPRGNGYYTIEERRFAYGTFQFGFLVMWITLIIMGTFLRGPNWNIFGPYEVWDAHKVEALSNVNLSEMYWKGLLHTSLPKAPSDSGMSMQFWYIFKREWLGIVLTIGYLVVVPPILATTVFRSIFVKMGFFRFMLMSNLLLLMASLPIKMVLRWTLNLKYIIAIPEYFLNL